MRSILAAMVLISALISLSSVRTSGSENGQASLKKIKSWRDLAPTAIEKSLNGVLHYRFKTENGSEANLVVLDLKAGKVTLKPFFNRAKGTTSDAAGRVAALAAINGGYFNLSDGESASYVIIDGKSQCDPRTNHALVGNPKLKSYLPMIFNRSELRILSDITGRFTVAISAHGDPVADGYKVLDSIQAGPRLLPQLTAREEAFIRTDSGGVKVDSIGCCKTAARTAVGITQDQHVLLLCVAGEGQNEFSSGISLPALASLLQHLGCKEAINFDGGTSTTMVLARDWNSMLSNGEAGRSCAPEYDQVCGITPEKLIKSGLAVIPTP